MPQYLIAASPTTICCAESGNNLRAAAFGIAVYCSHGMERTHINGLNNTMNLLLAYVLDI